MTGKELILYILQHDLENTEIFQNGRFLDYLTVGEVAVKYGVGEATVRSWYQSDMIDGIQIGGSIYILPTAKLKMKGMTAHA